MVISTITIVILLLSLIYLLHDRFSYILSDKDQYLSLIQLVIILAFIVVFSFRNKTNYQKIIKNISSWLLISLVALIGYSYQYEIKAFANRLIGNITPSLGLENSDDSITFYASQNGHFMIDGKINNESIRFLLDTGASKTTLNHNDALRIGINVKELSYDIPISTANGTSFVALAKIQSIEIKNILIRNIDVYVSKDNLSTSLLGMNFLNKLKKYEVTKNSLTLWSDFT